MKQKSDMRRIASLSLVAAILVAVGYSMQTSYSSETPISSAEMAKLQKATLAAG